MGPQNAVIGEDANFGTDLPTTQAPEADISRERNMAKFSKTKEFESLKQVIQGRIDFHKKFVPSGESVFMGKVPIKDLSNEERGWRWLAADCIIEELQGIIQAYEMANEVVKDVTAAETKRRQSA